MSLKKVKFLLFPFLKALGISVFGLGILRWLVDFFLHIEVSVNLWNYWFPGVLVVALWWFFLRRPINVLEIPNKRERGYFYVHLVSIVFIGFPTMLSQFWMEESAQHLVEIESIREIDPKDPYACYRLDSLSCIPESVHGNQISELTGRRSTTLHYYAYFTVRTRLQTKDGTNVWIGKRYHTSMSGGTDESIKQERWESFYNESLSAFRSSSFNRKGYLRRVPKNADLKNYMNAIYRSPSLKTVEHIVFEAVHGEPGSGTRRLLLWTIGVSAFGVILCVIAALSFPQNTTRHQKYLEGKGVFMGDEVEIRRFLLFKTNMKVTTAIFYVNMAFVAWMILNDISFYSPGAIELLDLGGIRDSEVLNGAYWRLLTSQFIHAGFIHLMNNMIFLLLLGYIMELQLKSWKYLLIYLVSGIAAGWASIHFNESTVAVGASGALFGLLGWLVGQVVYAKSWTAAMGRLKFLGIFGGISLIIGFVMPYVDNAAHVGGLIAGIILGFIVRADKESEIFG